MTEKEMALKVVVGKHIIADMAKEPFWVNLVNGQVERMAGAVERALERIVVERMPETDEEASRLIVDWAFPVRTAVLEEFMPA